MYRRTSPQDGKSYAIGFEMRLPNDWNGRFFYQANGGIDGTVSTALGGGGPVPTPALQQGFAVVSSDAGHTGANDPSFGVDAQARLDYGYQAVAKLTPMAKALIAAAYGKAPDRSYIGGCSNGGRHTFVAMTRTPDGVRRLPGGRPGLPPAAGRDREPVRGPAVRDRGHEPRRPRHAPSRLPSVPTLASGGAGPVRRARRRHGRADPGHHRVPGGLRPRPRRAHLPGRA